uniref:THAP domain-containing protein 5 n=1 Tax=Schizaphis graminum TaxID=13262 RepID=A0A2S2NEE6_SCHGA
MPTCYVVPNCKSRGSIDSDFHFFTFPINDGIRLEKWMLAINRQGFIPKKSSRICNIHFLKADFVNSPGGIYKLKLKSNTVPSVFPGRPVASTSISSESPVYQSDVFNYNANKKATFIIVK